MALVHSFRASCSLHEQFNDFTRRASGVSEEPPKIRAHFFYSSTLPIDDPLSPLPAPSTTYQSGHSKVQPRPFSAYDNAALEEAWQGLNRPEGKDRRSKIHRHGPFCNDTGIVLRSNELRSTEDGHSSSKQEEIHKADKHGHGLFCSDNDDQGSQSNPSVDAAKVHGHGPYCSDIKSRDQQDIHFVSVIKDVKESPKSKERSGLNEEEKAFGQNTKSNLSAVATHSDNLAKADCQSGVIETIGSGSTKYPSMRRDDSNSAITHGESPMLLCDDPQHDEGLYYKQGDSITAVPHGGSTKKHTNGDSNVLICDDPQHIPFEESMPITTEELDVSEHEDRHPEKRHRSIFHRSSQKKQKAEKSPKPSRSPSRHKVKVADTLYGSNPSERQTTGTPFLRAPSPNRQNIPARHDGLDAASDDEGRKLIPKKPSMRRFHSDNSDLNSHKSEADSTMNRKYLTHHRGFSSERKEENAYVPVGLSRLHLVEMPVLEMKPIYWSPVHDISSVIRGTWFYKETMMPVESDVANQLEEGYEYMRPWTESYKDEINSCLEIGAEAELKIVYKLWPSEEPKVSSLRPESSKGYMIIKKSKPEPLTPEEKARKHAAEVAASKANRAVGTLDEKQDEPVRLYHRSSVIYANGRDAQILKPSMLPSVARGRKPLGPIRKGRTIGTPVVRGFDYQAWDKLYPPKKSSATKKALAGAAASQSGAATTINKRDACPACVAAEERPQVTDLVLVIHGIGQKLSERIESYHFTHAINSFRRQLNVELESEAVQPWLRAGLGGIMVLPVNWRSTLTFEDGGPHPEAKKDDRPGPKEFTLKDITADTIPAVRNLISDVMLDIPYYLSHHKPKMIEAVIKEANRIYRLWCRNNPGFQKNGRVHLIAHSLGSVMALDILSKQPTKLPKQLDLTSKKFHGHMFEFDTTNLFFCGSPAGFFLLLNHAPLIPRMGRAKPESDGEDTSSGIAGDAGTYGCLAVDNIYNIMHYNDPIAYRVNACVDVDYAASLQPASVPSATSTWLQTIGSVFRGKATAVPQGMKNLETLPTRPTVGNMPSTIEMETHNFTLEEIAEKRMYLLNDNGQIDYFLSSGGGPLEIQYLNMLSAHSSYWILQDFVRFLVVEIGRKPGRSETVLGMRAVKKVWVKR